jgi:osmotically-inducible protein OsmY
MYKFYLKLASYIALTTSLGCSSMGLISNNSSAISQYRMNGTSGIVQLNSEKDVSDAEITSSIEEAFKKHPEIATANLEVYSKDGVVNLSGTVPNAQTYNRAISLVRSIPGVRIPINASDLRFQQ